MTREVIRLTKAWHLPYYNTAGTYDDHEDGATNDERQEIFSIPNPSDTSGNWFSGDFVPFQQCAYIVAMHSDSDGSAKYYSFMRYNMRIEYDSTLEHKTVVSGPEAPGDAYALFKYESGVEPWNTATDLANTSGTKLKNFRDFPRHHVPIQFVPYWGSFVWLSRNYIVLKVDTTYDTRTKSDVDSSAKDGYMMNQDPCARTTPLFNNCYDSDTDTATMTCLEHYTYELSNDQNSDVNRALAMEYAFDSLWIITSANDDKLYRLGGLGPDSLEASEFFTIDDISGTSGGTWDPSQKNHLIDTSYRFNSMCSMEFYGLFLGVDTAGYFIRLAADPLLVDVDSDNELTSADLTNGLMDLSSMVLDENVGIAVATPQQDEQTDTASALETDNQNNYRFLQAQGFLTKHRPCYMVTDYKPTQVSRVTTEIVDFIAETDSVDASLYEEHNNGNFGNHYRTVYAP